MAHQSTIATASVTRLSPEPDIKDPVAHHDRPDEHEDLTPSDSQPPGVDKEVDYNSLEEALMGEN